MKIGVYVGSFNPVHIGHKYIMDFLLEKGYVDKVIVIATQGYWDKNNLVDLEHRIHMLKFYESDRILVDDSLNNVEYTHQILNLLKAKYPSDEFYLIIGADNVPKFHLWKNVDEILKNKVLVLKRDDIDVEKYVNEFPEKDNFIVVEDFEKVDISSTCIRNDLDSKKEYLDKEVYHYIKRNRLYENE